VPRGAQGRVRARALRHAVRPQPDGTIYQRPFGGHTANYGEKPVQRACAAADRTGHAMLHTLYQQNVKARTSSSSSGWRST
jgi:succinate dehydrogenase/fumarate reductase flavoprotein subunit